MVKEDIGRKMFYTIMVWLIGRTNFGISKYISYSSVPFCLGPMRRSLPIRRSLPVRRSWRSRDLLSHVLPGHTRGWLSAPSGSLSVVPTFLCLSCTAGPDRWSLGASVALRPSMRSGLSTPGWSAAVEAQIAGWPQYAANTSSRGPRLHRQPSIINRLFRGVGGRIGDPYP